jgi:hypothetical protein
MLLVPPELVAVLTAVSTVDAVLLPVVELVPPAAVPPLPFVESLVLVLSLLSEPHAPKSIAVERVATKESGRRVRFLTGASLPKKPTRCRVRKASHSEPEPVPTVLLERARIWEYAFAQKEQVWASFS